MLRYDVAQEDWVLKKILTKAAMAIGFSLALVQPIAALSQTIDCSALSSMADKTACQNPGIREQKAAYEKLLMQLRRANPGSLDTILSVNRQKMQELNAQCQTADCVSAWYSQQIEALHQGTWAKPAQKEPTVSAQVPLTAEPVTQAVSPQRTSREPAPSSPESPSSGQVAEPSVPQEQPRQDQTSSHAGDEPSSEEAAFKAWQASQAKEPEAPAQPTTVATPVPQAEVKPQTAPKAKAPDDDLGFFTLLFTAVIGLPLAYPIWKIIVWMDKYMISRAERYHRPAAQIILPQIGGSLAIGLFISFVIVSGIKYGWRSLFS